jgi:two-component system, OmpR family, response regulator VicR
MKILICEDDSMTLQALEHSIRQEGYTTVTARDGLEAKSILDNESIDFVLTDLHMPNIDGLELIEHIRNKLKKNFPIIMLTRVGSEDTVLKAFEIGADDYITKPFSPKELSLRIKRALMRNH